MTPAWMMIGQELSGLDRVELNKLLPEQSLEELFLLCARDLNLEWRKMLSQALVETILKGLSVI